MKRWRFTSNSCKGFSCSLLPTQQRTTKVRNHKLCTKSNFRTIDYSLPHQRSVPPSSPSIPLIASRPPLPPPSTLPSVSPVSFSWRALTTFPCRSVLRPRPLVPIGKKPGTIGGPSLLLAALASRGFYSSDQNAACSLLPLTLFSFSLQANPPPSSFSPRSLSFPVLPLLFLLSSLLLSFRYGRREEGAPPWQQR